MRREAHAGERIRNGPGQVLAEKGPRNPAVANIFMGSPRRGTRTGRSYGSYITKPPLACACACCHFCFFPYRNEKIYCPVVECFLPASGARTGPADTVVMVLGRPVLVAPTAKCWQSSQERLALCVCHVQISGRLTGGVRSKA